MVGPGISCYYRHPRYVETVIEKRVLHDNWSLFAGPLTNVMEEPVVELPLLDGPVICWTLALDTVLGLLPGLLK